MEAWKILLEKAQVELFYADRHLGRLKAVRIAGKELVTEEEFDAAEKAVKLCECDVRLSQVHLTEHAKETLNASTPR